MTKARILVVEDEAIVAEDIRVSLESLGYVVCAVVSSAEDAINVAGKEAPDLVLMDIMLKGKMDGIEAAGQIRSHFNIPFIYITAYSDEKTLERAKLTEPFGYIIKPFEDRDLKTTIEMALYKSEMERRLREQKEWFSTTLSSIGDAVIATDAKGSLIFMNPVAEALTGWKQDEAIGRPLGDIFVIINEKTRKGVENPVSKVIREGVVAGLANHTILVTRDGSEIAIDDSGAPIRGEGGNIIGVVLIFRDVSERRKAEQALQESEERYRTLYESAIVGLYRSRIEDGKILMANKITADTLGYGSVEELVREYKFAENYSPERRAKLLHDLEKYGSVSDFEIQVTRKDGRKVDLMITAMAYPESGYIEGAMMDITEKKRLRAQLVRAEHMEAIGTLAGGIAHDFNNLLMGIQGYVSLMLDDLDLSHPHYEKLKRIEDQVKSGAELTSQLLGFARGGKYHVKTSDVNDIVKRSLGMFGRTKKEIAIREKYAANLWPVEVDQNQIEQVLLNLYVNAWQAMSDGGNIYIETGKTVLDEEYVKPYGVAPGRYVKISVSDTGIGMDKATQARIFEPFFTTKEVERGTGLGLASAYGIIQNHAGIIDVSSEKGLGTTFDIYLPASEGVVANKGSRAGSKVIERGRETILLVDDEQIILDVAKEMLAGLGYNILSASRGEEALDLYKANRERIDIVILDMVMPGMGGEKVYDRLKEIDPSIKVILSSGYTVNGNIKRILEHGCNDFIQKPFTLHELSQKIRGILDKPGNNV